MSPQAPTWESVVNCPCVMVHTQNCGTLGQKLRDPPVALVLGTHKVESVHRSENLLIIIIVCN